MKEAPSSLYRLQLSKSFTLKEATKLIPYLTELGVEGVYCSPYFAAYSPHGYDITDPNELNSTVATEEEYLAFCASLKKHNLYHFADLVPNHMGILGENNWWKDVLEKGKTSSFASFFDIDWSQEKILVPLLGTSYEEALSSGAITLEWRGERLLACYGEADYPLNPATYTQASFIETPDEIDDILSEQCYQLAHHGVSAQQTSYRRFFNINELIGLRIEDPHVFDLHHKLALDLLQEGKVDGLRIDHPDGLYDPAAYFQRLREHHKGVIIVEKILGEGEELPTNWEVDGTVGYEYLNHLSGLFIRPDETLTQIYEEFTGNKTSLETLLIQKKLFYIHTEMAGDVASLAERFYDFSSKMRAYADLPKGEILSALYTLLTHFPVYRSYIGPEGSLSKEDAAHYKTAFKNARKHHKEYSARGLDFFEEVFALRLDTPYIRDCILRFQQLSAPIMAKGFEDITLYNYNRLISLNEVGGEPGHLGTSVEKFHTQMKRKAKKWPLGFISTSTHDTKRSLDARMQISALSEIPKKWEKAVRSWAKLNEKHKTEVDGKHFPDRNAEYFLYQTLIGVWPNKPSFKRLWPLWQKSLREARAHTSWQSPNASYEKAAHDFLEALLKPRSTFYRIFTRFQKGVETVGRLNTLSATALKLGLPGIIDVYEGCENWRFTLVDPDNRSPIETPRTQKVLKDGKEVKLDLHRRLLGFRKEHKELFLYGDYTPIEVRGSAKEHIVAYLRSYKNKHCLVVATRHFASFKRYGETEILLPKDFGSGMDVLSQKEINFSSKNLKLKKLLTSLPFSWIYWG